MPVGNKRWYSTYNFMLLGPVTQHDGERSKLETISRSNPVSTKGQSFS